MTNLIKKSVEERNSVDGQKERNTRTENLGAGKRAGLSVSLLREKGHEAMQKGQVQAAVQFYSQSLRHEVTVPLLCRRADAYLKLKMYDDAIRDCTTIVKLQPKVWRAYALRAVALREQGFFIEAMADLRQAKQLCPRRGKHLENLRVKCRLESESMKRALCLQTLIKEGSKQPPRPFVKGDKRVSPTRLFLRIQGCFRVIMRVLDEPGLGAVIWKEDALDRWKRVQMGNKANKSTAELCVNYDNVVIVQRLENLQYFFTKGGREMRLMLGPSLGFPTLLAAYKHQDLLVLKIIHEALQDGDDINIRAFLQAQPFPTLIQSFQDPRHPMRNIACALLDLIASYKSQKILTVLMHENLMPLLLKYMHSGSATQHASCVSLFFKLALDPRLVPHLLKLLSLQDLCEGLSRACQASKLLTRLHGAQAITTLLEFERVRQTQDCKVTVGAIVPLAASQEEPACNRSGASLLTTFANGGVLRAVALLLARESEQVPQMEEISSSIWEEDVELICEEITNHVNDFSEMHECTLRDFSFLSGHAQIAMLSAVRAMDFMAYADCAIEVLDQVYAWRLFIPLLSSFPHKLAAISIKTLAKFCRRSKRVTMHVANLWPANSSLIVLELARSAHRSGDSQTYQAAMLILAELAVCKSFLASMQKPTSFTVLLDFLQDGKSTTVTLTAICTCLAVAVTNSNMCVEFVEIKAYALGGRLLQLWCEYRAETQFRRQVENLMFVLMDKSSVLQGVILFLLENGNPEKYTSMIPGKDMVSYRQPSHPFSSGSGDATERYLAFSQNRMNLQEVCSFLSTIVQPSTKFANLCAGAGLLSVQVAKHFKEIHCYSVNCKRSWVEHTRRLAKQEAVQNLTAVLCKSFDKLPHALPANLDVAILCLSLDLVEDFGRLYRAIIGKLQQHGKLVLIDDKEDLMIGARMQASSYGLRVVAQSTMAGQYFVVVLQRNNDLNNDRDVLTEC